MQAALLTCACTICEREGEGELDSLLINDVIDSQWEHAVALVSIQAPPPASVHGSPHGLQHHIFTMRYSAADRGRNTEMLLLAVCSDVNLPCTLRNSLFITVSISKEQLEEWGEMTFFLLTSMIRQKYISPWNIRFKWECEVTISTLMKINDWNGKLSQLFM